MGNEKEGSAVVNYKAPAIMITERNGDTEKVLEFATADDYAAYKRIEDWSLMTDKQKDRAEITRIFEESLNRCHWTSMRSKNKI